MVDLRSLRRGCWITDRHRAGHVDLFQLEARTGIDDLGAVQDPEPTPSYTRVESRGKDGDT